MATNENVVIRISSTGAVTVRRDLNSIGRSADTSARRLNGMTRALGALSSLLALNELARAVDTFTTLQNRLRGLGYDLQTVNAVYSELVAVAGRTRTSLEATATVYQRVALATKEMGVSQREVIDFTETLNRAVIVSGANAIEARNAMIQLSQGMASGRLSGDELRSVLEQLPYVADLIARQMGVTRGELRKLGSEGAISTMVILDAMKNYRQEVAETYDNTLPTLSQALIVARDRWTDYIGRLDQAVGVQSFVANGILEITQHLDPLASGLLAVGAAMTVAFGPRVVGMILGTNGALLRLGRVALANPLVAIAAAVVGLTTYLFAMRSEILLGVDDLTTLGDLFTVFGRDALPWLNTIKETLGDLFGGPLETLRSLVGEFDTSAAGILMSLGGFADRWMAIWQGLIAAVRYVFATLPSLLSEEFVSLINVVTRQVERLINTVIAGMNFLYERLNVGREIGEVSLALQRQETQVVDSMRGLAYMAATAFQSTFEQSFNERNVTGYIQGLIIRAQWEAERRLAETPTVDLNSGGGGRGDPGLPDPDAVRAAENLAKLYQRRLADLQKEIALIDKRSELEKLDYDLRQGELAGISAKQQERLRYLAAVYDHLSRIQDVREQFVQAQSLDDLFRSSTVAESLEGPEGRIARRNINERVTNEALGGRPTVGGLDPQYNGAFGELNRMQDENQKLQEWYDERLAMYRDYKELEAHNAEHYDGIIRQIEEQRQKDTLAIERQTATARLAGYQDLFGTLAGLTASFAGRNSAITRAMLAFQQSAALAQSIINIQAAMAQAGGSLPFPANLAAIATVAASTAGIVSTIAGVDMPAAPNFSGNFDAGGYIPRGSYGMVGEYGVELVSGPANVKGRMQTAHETNSNDGGMPINVRVIFNDPGVTEQQGATAEMTDDRTLDIRVANLISKGGTRTSTAITTTTGTRRKGTK